MDLLETFRDMTGSILDLYLSSISNRTKEGMRALTVIVTILIPLTFIVGIYGMNFARAAGASNRPGPDWPFGYLLVWGVMVLIAVIMLISFAIENGSVSMKNITH